MMCGILCFIETFVFASAIVVNFTYTVFSFFSFYDVLQRKRNYSDSSLEKNLKTNFYRPISLLVPAYNEELTVVSSLHSQLNIDYAEFEIIVVNDGSKDNTIGVLTEAFDLIEINKPIKLDLHHKPIDRIFMSLTYANLTVIDKQNGGKFDAINCGINASSYPLFCVVDADSLLEPDSLLRAGAMFAEDHSIVGIGGTVRPLNGCTVVDGRVVRIKTPSSFIEMFQSIEYMRGFLLGRSAWNVFGSLLIISGAFGVFRKDIVKSIGGYRHTVGEDMDLVIRIHKYCLDTKLPYRIISIPDTICWTQVPNDWESLAKQRNRWQRGLVDCLVYNRSMLFNPKYKNVGMLGLPYFLFVEAFGALIEFGGYAALFFILIFSDINGHYALMIALTMFVWANYITLSAVFFDNLMYRRYEGLSDLVKLVAIGTLESFGYRQFLSYHRFIGSMTFWKSGWGVVKRGNI